MAKRQTVLVLVHGGALSGRMFRTTAPELERLGYTSIITPDLPGHGSSKQLGPFSFAKSTEVLHGVIQGLRAKHEPQGHKIMVAGISLGGQAVLDLLAHHPGDVDSAIVSGASIAPPDERAGWEMPHMPSADTEEGKKWHEIMMEDVSIMGMENAAAIQQTSFAFSFEPGKQESFPPTMILVGEHDTAMAKRDAAPLFDVVKRLNDRSVKKTLVGAWHSHSIDVPDLFAKVIADWDEEIGKNA